MTQPTTRPTGVEVYFDDDEIIVSKTDTRGIIIYANEVFLKTAGYTESEILGQAHNCIRHPDMPRCVFKLLWDVLAAGEEVFAYVKNQTKNGDHYWVFAHVTPSFDDQGAIIGYHSNRRVPERDAVRKAEELYTRLLAEENKCRSKAEGLQASSHMLNEVIDAEGIDYHEFVWSL